MLGKNLYQQSLNGARFSRRAIIVIGGVVLVVIVLVAILASGKHDSSTSVLNAKKPVTTAEKLTNTATIGSKDAGSTLTIPYPLDWTLEKTTEDTGGETAIVQGPNGLTAYLAANVPLESEDDDGSSIVKVGSPFTIKGASYQLVAVISSSNDEDSTPDDLEGVYITTPDATSQYMTSSAPRADGTVIHDAYGILNTFGDDGTFIYKSVEELQSDPDYPTALAIIKQALAERQ